MRINFILLKAINSVKINIYKNIINKSGGENLKNQVELIDKIMSTIDFTELNNHNFKIIDPQHTNDKELYNHIKNAKNIITTNGSALCPLIILNNPNIKVFCLNSNRYLPEWRRSCKNENEVICKEDILKKKFPEVEIDNFEKNLWRHVTCKFNFTYVDSYENVITDDQLDYIIKNINL